MNTSLITDKFADACNSSLLLDNENANVSKSERLLSIASGSFLFFKGLTNLFSHPLIALGEVAVGSFLVHRGVTGECAIKPMIEADEAVMPMMADTVIVNVS